MAEVALTLDGEAQRRRADHDLAAWAAWHVAALTRAKKMPPLKKLLSGARSPRRQQTGWQHQLKMVEMINAALGGEPRGNLH